MGLSVGGVGETDGVRDGVADGAADGREVVGAMDGASEGLATVGILEGVWDGLDVVGALEGLCVGLAVGYAVAVVGLWVGWAVGRDPHTHSRVRREEHRDRYRDNRISPEVPSREEFSEVHPEQVSPKIPWGVNPDQVITPNDCVRST